MPRDPGFEETEPATQGGERPATVVPAQIDHFAIERPLGAGGMGVVFVARDVALGRAVALKLVRPRDGDAQDEHHERLLREAQALARLSHPNVVTVYEVGEAGGNVFIAMELIDGTTLREWMGTPRPWREIAATFLAAGRGLAAVHAIGLVHRDFKPSNVFVDHGGAIKVGDFGLVRAQGETAPSGAGGSPTSPSSPPSQRSLTSTGAVVGTPAYMAPEQARGEAVDARADQYSFCVSLKEALTGAPSGLATPEAPTAEAKGPRSQEAPSARLEARPIPRPLRPILERGLDADPSRRYPSMTALLEDLQRALRPSRRIEGIVLAAAVAIAGIVIAVIAARGGGPARPVTTGETVAREEPWPQPPLDPADRAEADGIAAEVRRLDEVRRNGDKDAPLREETDAVVRRARTLGHKPTLVETLDLLSRVQSARGEHAAAADTLREITQLAAATRQDEQAARAWVRLVHTVGTRMRKPDEAFGLLAAAEAAVVRAGSPIDLRVQLLFRAGELYNVTNKPAEALPRFDEARRLLTEAGGDLPGASFTITLGDILLASASAHATSGDRERAVGTYHEVIATLRRTLGPDSKNEGLAWHNLGNELTILGRPKEGADAYREAVRIRRGRQGETGPLAFSMVGLATALQSATEWDEAFRVLEEAVRISREKMDAGDPKRAHGLIALGNAYMQRKRWREAAATLEEVIAFYERTGARSENYAVTLFNRGDVDLRQRRFAASIVWYDKAVAAFEASDGPQSRYLVFPLEAKGRALVELRRPSEALAPLERALALSVPAKGEGSQEQASARYHRGRALVESGADREGGLEEARAGRAALAALAADAALLEPIDRWLAKHGVKR